MGMFDLAAYLVDAFWFDRVGLGFFVSPISTPVDSKRRIRKAKKAVQDDTGEYVMQADLNEVFVGPVFDFTVGLKFVYSSTQLLLRRCVVVRHGPPNLSCPLLDFVGGSRSPCASPYDFIVELGCPTPLDDPILAAESTPFHRFFAGEKEDGTALLT